MLLSPGARRPGHGQGSALGFGATSSSQQQQQQSAISSPAAMAASHHLAAPPLPPGLPPLDPAANPRCWHMAREAQAFSRELAALRAALAEHAASTAALLGVGPAAVGSATHAPSKGAAPLDRPSSVAAMLAAPLPRVWDSVEGRLAEPLRATATHYGSAAGGVEGAASGLAATAPPAGPATATASSEPSAQESRLSHTVGGGGAVPSFAALEAAAAELLSKVDGSVLAPLDAWQRDLALATARLPELETLRAELGSALARADETRARAEAAAAAAAAAVGPRGGVGGRREAAVAEAERLHRQQGAGAGGEAATPMTTTTTAMSPAARGGGADVGAGRGSSSYYRVRLVPPAMGAAAGGGGGPAVVGFATALGLGAGRRRSAAGRNRGLGGLFYACTHPRAAHEGAITTTPVSSSPYDRQYGKGGFLGRRRRARLHHLGRGGTALSPPASTEPGAAGAAGAAAGTTTTTTTPTTGPISRRRTAHAARQEEDAAIDAALAQRAAEAARASFQEMEAASARQLSALCRDAAWAKSYAQAELVSSKDALQAAAVGLGPVLLPLPGLFEHHPSAPPRGAFASIAGIAFAPPLMPTRPVEEARARGAVAAVAPARAPAGAPVRVEAAARELAAGPHVATAAPMLRGARPDVSGMERAPVPTAGRVEPAMAAAGGVGAGGAGLAPTTPARAGMVGGAGVEGGGVGATAAAAPSPEPQVAVAETAAAAPVSSMPVAAAAGGTAAPHAYDPVAAAAGGTAAPHAYDPARRTFVQQH